MLLPKSYTVGLVLLGTVVLGGCSLLPQSAPEQPTPIVVKPTPKPEAPAPMPEEPDPSIVEIVVNTDDVSILRDIVVDLGLVDTLNSEGPFTVFAPTNEAFTTLLEELSLTYEELAQDEQLLTSIVLYHVLDTEVSASTVLQVANGSEVETINGEAITVYNQNGVQINESTVIQTDIEASNGVIHLIDTVLLPPSVIASLAAAEEQTIVATASESGDFPTLVAAIEAAGLVETLNSEGPFTVFAPTEEAFAALLVQLDVTAEQLLADTALLTDVLTYHVLEGVYTAETVLGLDSATDLPTVQGSSVTVDPNDGQPMINESMITATDITASNGIIHVIDAVLIPSE